MKAYRFNSVIFETENTNYYIFSQSLGCVLYLHPIILHLLCNNNHDLDIQKYSTSNCIVDISLYPKDEIDYYSKKLELYINAGVFSSVEKNNIFSDEIKERDIIESVTHTEQLAIELIQNCNLNCTYCIYGELYKNPFKYASIDLKTIKKIIDYLCNIWNQSKIGYHEIRINYYGGEPLLKFKEIVSITNYIKSKKINNIKFTFGLTTNGTLLNKEIVDFFVKNDFIIAISLDGNKNSNSYRIQKNGTEIYSNIYKIIKTIKEKHPKYFENNIHFISVLHDRNFDFDIRNYFLSEFGTNKVNIGALNHIDLNENRINDFKRIFRPLKSQDDILVNKTTYKPYREIIKLKNNYPFWEKNKTREGRRSYTGTCIPLQKKLFINANYSLMPCEKISFEINFGKIFQDGKINDINYKEISTFHNRNLETVIDRCKKCYYSEMCSFCIYTFNKDKNGRYKCDKFMNIKAFTSYLSMLFLNLENNQQLY